MNPQHRPYSASCDKLHSISLDGASRVLIQRDAHYVKRKSEVTLVPSLNTVQQTAPNARHFGDTFKTLFRWRESIYKFVWKHLLLYYICYVSLTLINEYALNDRGKKHFEAITKYFSKNASTLNLMIMLGFFTSVTLQRLFTMQTSVPGTAKITSSFIMSLKLDLPEGSIIVNQYARWAVLAWILSIRSVSQHIRKQFPDMISLQRKGILFPQERLILERAETDGVDTPRPLVVIDWMLLLLKECLKYGRYNNKSNHGKNVELLMAYKKTCGNMIKFATRNVPHALIQAVIIAVYYFGLVTMLARDLTPYAKSNQPVGNPQPASTHQQEDKIDYPDEGFALPVLGESTDSTAQTSGEIDIIWIIVSYFPIMPFMQFFIFFAWLTFGRMAVNPFGDDETDIDLQMLIESHIQDYRRLTCLYETNLEDLFPGLPQKRYNEVALTTDVHPKSPKLPKVASSPAVPKLAIEPKASIVELPNEDASIRIEEEDEEDDTASQKKVPWWKKAKNRVIID